MKENNEVTLKINENVDMFKENLEKKGYKEAEHFILYDTFMIPDYLEIEKLSTREIISKAIIIRKVEDITKNEVRRDMSYKMKKFSENGDILEQKSTRLKILDCDDAEIFMKTIGYKKIMNIIEEDYTYKKSDKILTIKDIKDGDKLIEAETQVDNEKYDTIDKLKEWLMNENFSLDFNNCFIKKAEIELNKVLNRV